MLGTELLWSALLVVLATILFYRYSIENHQFWKKKRIPYVKPIPFFGTLFYYMSKPIHEVDIEWNKIFGRIYGTYDGTSPILMVSEPTILREILIKDFHIFPNRRARKLGDPIIDKILFIQQGEDWKRIRKVMSPLFSTGKIKRMLPIFKESAQTVVENFNKAIERGAAIELIRIYGAFTMDVIASCTHSIKIDSLNDPDNEFVCHAKRIFEHKYSWRKMMLYLFPKLSRWLRMGYFPPSCTNFFQEVSFRIINERKKACQTKNDFLQMLMDLTNELQDNSKPKSKEESGDFAFNYGANATDHQIFENVNKNYLFMDELVAQCVMFLIAGYDSTTKTLSLVTYELALNPDVQEKVHQEIVNALKESKGELTYNALQSMKFLDCVISETLRIFPPVHRIDRQSVAEYTLGDTGITIPKNSVVTVPIFAMHRDPEFFPNPDKFDPDRFIPEKRHKRDTYCYNPFGAGPRNCIARRFVLIEIKVCLVNIIASFEIKKSLKTQVPLKFLSGQAGTLQPIDIHVAMVPRDGNPIVK